VIIVESGGDNLGGGRSVRSSRILRSTSSTVAAGDKIPRKGWNPGSSQSGLASSSIKSILHRMSAASLEVMERDAPKKCAGERPFVFTNLKNRPRGSTPWCNSFCAKGMLAL